MQVKRFKAIDMRRALEMVRADLGDDAVILSSSKLGKSVEVLATADDCNQLLNKDNAPEPLPEPVNVFAKYDGDYSQDSLALISDASLESQPAEHLKQNQANISSANKERDHRQSFNQSELARQLEQISPKFGGRQSSEQADARVFKSVGRRDNDFLESNKRTSKRQPLNSVDRKQAPDHASQQESRSQQQHQQQQQQQQQQIAQLQTELSGMRELLEMQISNAQMAALRGQQLTADRRLMQMGFSHKFRQLFHGECNVSQLAKEQAWRATISYLSSRVKTVACDLISSGGIFAFIGPTGAGKTTTIAKLATRYVLTEGRESIALVTLDNARLGAQSQLKCLANILQIPLRTVARPEELNNTLASLDYCRLVLVDTPGVNGQTLNREPFVQQLMNMHQVSNLLVVSANAQARFQDQLMNAVPRQAIRAAVLTKLDETDTLGEAIEAVVSTELAIAYTTDGQTIPDDISLAKSHAVVSRAVAVLQQATPAGAVSGRPAHANLHKQSA